MILDSPPRKCRQGDRIGSGVMDLPIPSEQWSTPLLMEVARGRTEETLRSMASGSRTQLSITWMLSAGTLSVARPAGVSPTTASPEPILPTRAELSWEVSERSMSGTGTCGAQVELPGALVLLEAITTWSELLT